MEKLAHQIVERHPEIELGIVRWDHFEDGFPNFFVDGVKISVKGRHVSFLASFDTPAAIFEQMSVIYAFPSYLARSFKVLLPYFPTGTMERENELGEIATAKTLARMLSAIPISKFGSAEIVVFDIHALGERFYFGDQVVTRFESGIQILRDRLENMGQDISIAFPDDGAAKRFGRKFPDYPQIICGKVRDGDKRYVRIKEGNPVGRHVVIVDDLIQTGATARESGRVLKETGAEKVSIYATHGVFPKQSWRTFLDAGFEHVFITDSCPWTIEAVTGIAPFEVLSLSGQLAEIVLDH